MASSQLSQGASEFRQTSTRSLQSPSELCARCAIREKPLNSTSWDFEIKFIAMTWFFQYSLPYSLWGTAGLSPSCSTGPSWGLEGQIDQSVNRLQRQPREGRRIHYLGNPSVQSSSRLVEKHFCATFASMGFYASIECIQMLHRVHPLVQTPHVVENTVFHMNGARSYYVVCVVPDAARFGVRYSCTVEYLAGAGATLGWYLVRDYVLLWALGSSPRLTMGFEAILRMPHRSPRSSDLILRGRARSDAATP
ncbi:hypothetical protein P152DRAFT_452895 [Eremomyces bilateralis CBS 781.70]|uniref:Uncharacterized protein n=1 Tax=Eremomyces bilateralis CBS 781.70 TaxID=1392243 RepID=A0A6G1FRS9_9PEZI|nr:uncharacterized protein P152DRAFT_452895 [Eremomyces bilateralis CBS 781.70]KAF1808438.1 hypothetical protein P152DRAFT_452895 [Eremomyces bilateralis CBS 781.70]